MTYCVSCGQFEPVLHPFDFCESCFRLFGSDSITIKQIETSNRIVEKTLTKPLMSYLHELELFQASLFSNPSHHSETNTLHPAGGDLNLGERVPENPIRNPQDPFFQNQSPRGAIPPQYYGGHAYPRMIPTYLLRKSNIALVLMILGLFMPIFIGVPLELAALMLAINARRTEPRNWRQLFAIIGALFIIGLLFLALYLATIYPELFESNGFM